MASNDFINECKNNAYKNRLGTISIKDITKKSGSVITTDEAIEGPLKSYKIYGNTYQNSTRGVNLFNHYLYPVSRTYNGITITNNGDGSFTLNGTCTQNNISFSLGEATNIKKYASKGNVTHTAYYISGTCTKATSSNTRTVIRLNYDAGSDKMIPLQNLSTQRIISKKFPQESRESGWTWTIVLSEGDTFDNFTIKYQLEKGSEATEYEPYTGGQPSPNPDYPQEVISCGDRTKNMFDIDTIIPVSIGSRSYVTYDNINKSVTITNNSADSFFPSLYGTQSYLNGINIPIKKNTDYTFSVEADKSNLKCGVYGYNNSENHYTLLTSWLTSSGSVSFNSDNYEEVAIRFGSTSPAGTKTTFNKIQLEEGSTASLYEPYGYKIPINVRSDNLFSPKYAIETQYSLSGNKATGNLREYSLVDGAIICSSSNNTSGARFFNKLVLNAGTYSFSCDISQTNNSTQNVRQRIRNFDNLTDIVSSKSINVSSGKYNVSFTIEKTTTIGIMLKPNQDSDGTISMTKIQLVSGSTAPAKYIPYYNETTNIYLNEPLRKIDGYSDYIDFINGKLYRKITEHVFAGTDDDSYTLNSDNTNTLAVNINPNKKAQPAIKITGNSKIYSDKLNYINNITDAEHIYLTNAVAIDVGYKSAIRIYVDKSRLDGYSSTMTSNEKIALVKTWLQTNNLKVDYITYTPTEEDIELPNINLLEGKNIITIGTEVESIIEVEYTNWENKIKNSDRLQKVTIDNGCIVNNEIIGSVYSKKVTSDILDINELDLENKKIDVKIGVKYANDSNEILNMGKYTIERPKDEQTVNVGQITAYDDLNSKLEDKYICGIDYTQENKTLRDLYIDLCNQLGLIPKNLEFDNNTIPIANNPFTNGEKNRLVLQTIEKVSGTFSDIDNDTNEIDLCWLSNSVEPDYTFYRNDYTNLEGGKIVYGPINCLVIKNSQIDDENVTIKDDESIALNGEHTLTINEDYILYNSELRQLAINAIWNKVHNLTYVDCKLTTLYGKPFLKLGDKIRVYKTDTEYFDTYVLLHNFTYDGSFESTIQSPVLTEQEIKTKQKISLGEAFKNTEVEVNKQKQTITALVQETSENTEKTSQLQLQSDEINQRIEDSQYYIDEDGNKQTISGSINELKNTAEELNLNLQKIGGLNLMKNSSGQNGTIGYKGKMLKPYIEFQTWNEFNQYISTWSAVNDIYTCFIHVVGEASDSERDCWYGLYYQDGYSRRYYYEQVVWNGNYIYPDRYNFYMDFMYEELFTFVEANYTDTESFKKFLIDYTTEYTNISPNIFSSMTNDFIENSTIAKSSFLLIPTVRDTYTAMDEDYIYGESFTVPNNVNKLYFSVKSKIDGLCGKARLILYQLDDKMDNIQNNLNVYDFWTNHVISETVISIPDNLLNSDSFEEYKREVDILDNTVDILPCFSIGNNFVNDGAYVNFKNPILNPINRFYWKKVWETIDEVSAYYTYRSIHTKKKLQFFESSTVPEIPNTPDFTQLWLCTEDIDTYTKDKLYTPQYEVDNTGTILSKTWIVTDYTKEQIENNVEIIMFDGWTYVYSAMGEMDATPRPDMKFLIADCMVSRTDTSWQPASGENYWGKNIKISGDKGIYIYNTVDGYNRIIDEKQDIATDNSGNTLWQLTGKGMKTKRAECESIRLPKLEILCTSDSTAFYYKENEDDDYGA